MALAAHAWQDGVDHPAEAEEIDLKHPAHLVLLTLFHGAEIADARVVHEHINPAEPGLGRRDGGFDLVRVRDVELEHEGITGGRQPGDVARLARGHHGGIAQFEHMHGELAAEAGGAAGDEPDRLC